VYKFTLTGLQTLARLLFGEAKHDPERELGPYRLWTRAAEACGVENIVGKRVSFLAPPRIEGARPPLTVSIWPIGAAGSANARIFVRGVTREVQLAHESLRTKASAFVGSTETALGDPYFDDRFFLRGDPLVLRASFDAPTRALAIELFGPPVSLAGAFLRAEDLEVGIADGAIAARFVDRGYPHPPVTPEELLGKALALGERLVFDRVEERLAGVAAHDPLPDVRLGALRVLAERRPEDPATRAALQAGREDVDARVRLEAAAALGVAKGGRGTLLDLAADANAPDSVSARAVTELRSHLPVAQARSILADALRMRRLETAAACVERLGRGGEDADVIARVLAREAGELAIAAARALGRCGTPEDVPLLREIESRHPRTGPLAVACRGAAASIHTRQPGASQGRLSLSEDRTGRLSVPATAGGEISLAGRKGAGSEG
jgi:hypothetical protein